MPRRAVLAECRLVAAHGPEQLGAVDPAPSGSQSIGPYFRHAAATSVREKLISSPPSSSSRGSLDPRDPRLVIAQPRFDLENLDTDAFDLFVSRPLYQAAMSNAQSPTQPRRPRSRPTPNSLARILLARLYLFTTVCCAGLSPAPDIPFGQARRIPPSLPRLSSTREPWRRCARARLRPADIFRCEYSLRFSRSSRLCSGMPAVCERPLSPANFRISSALIAAWRPVERRPGTACQTIAGHLIGAVFPGVLVIDARIHTRSTSRSPCSKLVSGSPLLRALGIDLNSRLLCLRNFAIATDGTELALEGKKELHVRPQTKSAARG